ncbi:MAG: glycosyltransferase family 4 protein [Bacteroidota bacterium]
MARPRILYLYSNSSTFVRKDIAFLGRHFPIQHREFRAKGALKLLWMLVRQFFYLLGKLPRTEVIFVMFGGYHALLPAVLGRLFGKRVYIILGGTDCVSFPSINYGTFRKPLQGRFACRAYRSAHRLIPVHASLMEREDQYYRHPADPPRQGAYAFCSGLREKTPFTAIHNGYDPTKWEVNPAQKQPRTFITVAAITDPSKLVLKGIDLIAEVAPAFPDCTFVVVGFLIEPSPELKDIPNLQLDPFVSPEELRERYARAEFYLQLSVSEGFPNAISESMLAGCIPIGSRVAGIPDIVGDTGLLLDQRDPARLTTLLTEALALPDKEGRRRAARQRITTHFHLEKREQAYLELVRGT